MTPDEEAMLELIVCLTRHFTEPELGEEAFSDLEKLDPSVVISTAIGGWIATIETLAILQDITPQEYIQQYALQINQVIYSDNSA